MTGHLNVYELPTATNVCDQILREVMVLNQVSFAHVTMDPRAVSLLHQHFAMSEVYFILEGQGILYYGNKALEVTKGAYQVIPPRTPHKLRNTNNASLEHLVFAVPPFNPADVHLVDDSLKEYSLKTFENGNPIIAQDGAILHELLPPLERLSLNMGLAFGLLSPRKKATPHYHEKSEEVYYVVYGQGKLSLGDSTYNIRKGSVIYVPTKTIHGLENTATDKELEVLCLSSPPYTDEDFLLTD